MKRKTIFALLAALSVLAAAACALLLLFRAREKARQTQVGAVSVEPIPTEALPVPERTEEWFVGDWAGLITGYGESDPGWTDFGIATVGYYEELCCLLRVYTTASGYEAALGSALWRITGHSMDGFSMVCTRASRSFEFHPDSIYYERFEFEEGQTIAFTYSEEVKSTVPGAKVPERHILFGEASARENDEWNHHLLLSLLPSGEQRGDDSGVYPHWYGGYENMKGAFRGMFCLGINARDKRMLGQVLDRGDGIETVLGVFDGMDYDRTRFFAPRDTRAEDLTLNWAMGDASGAFFPQFYRYSADGWPDRWANVSAEHKLYYETVYIPQMQAQIEALRAGPQDIWTLRQILARQGFIEYAQKFIYGEFEGIRQKMIPYIPQMVQLEAKYRFEVSLAGIKPGDTLADAQRLYDIRELREDEEERFGLYGLFRGKTEFYTDGSGLLLVVYPGSDGRIGKVEVRRPGYDTPDGRQVGDPYERAKMLLYAKDAFLTFGRDWSLQEGIDSIDVICMNVVLDRAWDEAWLDVDGDGEEERLTLSGRSWGSYLEQQTTFGEWQYGTVESFDFGTKATLRVYKGDALIVEEVLPIAMGYLTPSFCDKLQTDKPGRVWIVCETGGTGLEEPIYLLKLHEGSISTEYLGMIDIYS